MQKIRFNLLVGLLIFFSAALPSFTYGQIKTPFLLRYQTSIQGNLTLISNNVLSVSSTGNYNGTLGNHDVVTVFVDIDTDTTTFNSSNATLSLPSTLVCPAKKKVFLYWSAADFEDPGAEPDWNFNMVKLKIPGDTIYRLITADNIIYQGRIEHFYNDPYTCFKDITSLVSDDPTGIYWLANVKAKEGTLLSHGGGNTGTSGGWIIVFVYESTSLPQKNIALFDGYVHVANGMVPNPLPFTFSGFQTVPTGLVNVDFLMGSLEGDWDLTGDYCQIQKVDGSWLTMSSSLRQTNNFFHSIIGLDGAQFLNRTPASLNTLGFDADKFPIPNTGNIVIGNNQTSATIRMGTNQETYGLFLIGLAVDVWYPSILAIFTIPGMPGGTGGSVNAADTITFLLETQNLGNDATVNLIQTTLIPSGLDFLNVQQPLPPGVTFIYNNTTRLLQFNIPDDLVEVGDPPFTLQYQAKAINDCLLLSDSTISHPNCQVTSAYHGATNPAAQSTISSTALTSCGLGNLAPVAFVIVPPPSYPVAADDTATTPEDIPVSIPILANDTDCDTNINMNSIWVIQGPSHGTIHTIFNTGLVVYTPELNYHGPDTMRYRICDFEGLCDSAWIYVNVIPVNDPPVVLNEIITLCKNSSASGNILVNDADTIENTVLSAIFPPVAGPSHGTINFTTNGEFEYTPFPGYTGEDEIVILVCDAGFPLPPQCMADTMFILVSEVIQANAGPDQQLCMDSTATLNGNTSYPGTGNWTQISGPGNAVIIPQGASIATANGLIPGIYTFRYTVVNGSCISSDTTIVANEPLPTPASAGSDQFLCLEGLVSTSTSLAASVPIIGTGIWYQVQGPNAAIVYDDTSPNTLVSNLVYGNYAFTWVVTNEICPPSRDTVKILISRDAETNAGTNKTICENDLFEITEAFATDYFTIHWRTLGNGTFNDTTLLHPIYTPGTEDISSGSVQLVMTANSFGPCLPAFDTMILAFAPRPLVSAGMDGITCEMIPFLVTGTGIQHADSMTWSHNGKGILNGTITLTPVYTPAQGESGIVTLKITAYGIDPCSTLIASDEMQITIYKPLQAEAGENHSIPAGSAAFLTGSAFYGSGNYAFRWEPAELFENNTSKDPVTVPLTKDTTLYLFVYDSLSGCKNVDSIRIVVLPVPVHQEEECIKIYNTITPNGDGFNDQWIIDCIENFPANRVTIFDRWGNKINELENYNNSSTVWNGTNSKLEPVLDGTYYYIIAIKDGGTYPGWVFVRGGNK